MAYSGKLDEATKAFTGETPVYPGNEPETTEFEPMDRSEIQNLIRLELEDAKNYQQEFLAPRRAEATRRFRGEPYGDEEDGRSRVMSTDFRDTVMGYLPSLVEIFLGSERSVEFMPRGKGDEALARERTDYVNYVARVDNPGFEILYGAMKDALVRDYTILKWYWDERKVVEHETYEHQTEAQVRQLADDPDVTDVSYEVEDGGDTAPLPDEQLGGGPAGPPENSQEVSSPQGAAPAGAPPTPPKLYTVRIKRERKDGRARYVSLPGEEFYISREATCLEDAAIISHLRQITYTELLELGYDEKFIEDHIGSGDFTFKQNEEYIERRPEANARGIPRPNKDLRTVVYGEHLIRYRDNPDDPATLHQVCTIGDDYFIAKVADAPDINYAIGCPDPEPNELIGNGLYKSTADIARTKTAVMRATLDSTRFSIDPQKVVLDGQVDMPSVLNHEIGGVIIEYTPNSVRNLETTFVGQQGLAILDYLDGVLESRTGRTKGSAGLDADAMQSTTAMAVAAQVSAAQQRIKMVARVLGETMMKPLFAGLQRLIMRHQDIKRTVRLRGTWVEVDPSTWNAEMDVIVNVGLGNGMPQERIANLEKFYAVQKEFLQTMGPTPMVDFSKIQHTLALGAELAGWPDPTSFFGEVPEGWTPPAPAEKPDPAMLLAQAQAQDIQARLKIEADKLKLAHLELWSKTETDRMKIEADLRAKIAVATITAGGTADQQEIDRELEHMRIATDTILKAHETETDHSARVDEAHLAAQAQIASAPQGAPA